MPNIGLQAIVPKTPLLDTSKIQQAAQRQLQNDCLTVVNKIAVYPEQEDTDYVRSGQLGSNWKLEIKGPGEIWVVNRVTSSVSFYQTKTKGVVARRHAPRGYSQYVQGGEDSQSRVMAGKGWGRIDEAADEVFAGRAGVYSKLLAGG